MCLKARTSLAPFWLRAFCRDDSVFWSRNFAVRAVGSATFVRSENEQVFARANGRQRKECATGCMQDLGDRIWQTDCAHLIQVVVHCDELALQQLAARGCGACGHIANIPDDGAVELVALPTHTPTPLHTHMRTHSCRVALPGSSGGGSSAGGGRWTRTMANLIAEANVWLEASVQGTRLLPVTSNAACRQHHADDIIET